MTHTWFRFYNGALHDPKVQRLSPVLFRFWVNILCLTSSAGGTIPGREHIQFSTRLKPNKVSDFIGQLIDLKLIDETEHGLIPHNWHERQYKSDTSTDRVKRFRNVSKPLHETGPDSDTEQIQTTTTTASVVAALGFDDFFKAMPRRWDRKAALGAYEIALAKTTPEILLAGARRYSITARDYETQYILPPAKWLEAERWHDGSNGHVHESVFNTGEEAENQRKLKEKYYGQA